MIADALIDRARDGSAAKLRQHRAAADEDPPFLGRNRRLEGGRLRKELDATHGACNRQAQFSKPPSPYPFWLGALRVVSR